MKSTIIFISSIFVILTIGANIFAQDSLNIACLSRLELEGAGCIEVIGEFAFVGVEESGLHIINISDSENPEEVSSIETPGNIIDLAVDEENDRVYIVMGEAGWGIIDVSDPAEPEAAVEFIEFEMPIVRVEVEGDWLYLVEGQLGDCDESINLRILDVSDLENLNLLSSIEFFFVIPDEEGFVGSIFAVQDEIVYLIDHNNDLIHIYDVSNPENPELISRFGEEDELGSSIVAANDFVYVVGIASSWPDYDLYFTFRICDVSDPENPNSIGFWRYADHSTLPIQSIAVCGATACLGIENRIVTLNISTPDNPEEIGHFDAPNRIRDLLMVDDLLYATELTGLGIYYVCETPFSVISTRSLEFGTVRVGASKDLTLTITNVGEETLMISEVSFEGNGFSSDFEGEVELEPEEEYNLTVTFAPEEDAETSGELIITLNERYAFRTSVSLKGSGIRGVLAPTGRYAHDVFVIDDHAYIACTDALVIIDVSDPMNPDLTSRININDDNYAVSKKDNYAYVASFWDGLFVIDISNPEDPDSSSWCECTDLVRELIIDNDYAYLAGSDLSIINISEPENPELVCNFNVEYEAWGVFVRDDVVYTAGGDFGMDVGRINIFDVSNHRDPRVISVLETDYLVCDIFVVGDYAYVAADSSGLLIIDVSEPDNPAIMSTLDTPDRALEVFVVDNLAFVADSRGGGLLVINVQDPTNPALIDQFWTMNLGANEIHVLSNYAYVVNGSQNLVILDLSEPNGIRADQNTQTPQISQLFPAYPNPFNSTTTITYALPFASPVSLALYDLSGREVRMLVEGNRPAGYHRQILNASDLPSGLYFVRLEAAGFTATRKVMLVR